MKKLSIFLLFAALMVVGTLSAQSLDYDKLTAHPRLLLKSGDITAMRALPARSATAKIVHDRIIAESERIIGVETGACPHTAVREDPSMNLAAVEDMEARFPDGDIVLIESGGDNLTLTFSPALVDFFIYVIDVAAGDKIPRKDGPGISHSDILVINKTDLAPYVKASLDVMREDSKAMRGEKPFVMTNCFTGEGIQELTDLIRHMALFDMKK